MTSIGVVVPCRNEAATIERCLAALRAQDPAPSRIVVVDNGSSDGSDRIARSLADEVLEVSQGRIGGLRNAGAAAAGDVDVLAFVDADCELAPGWTAAAVAALAEADLVGSRSLADPGDTWVARRWAALEAGHTHAGSLIWSQHLAIRATSFRQLGGFDPELGTGEDVDLSRRVIQSGGRVEFVPGMVAVHHGFPSALPAFLRRERWHTKAPGWFDRMSVRSRGLVVLGAVWALLGGLSTLRLVTAGPRPLARWLALTAAAVPALGAAGGRSPRTAHQDGVLLGLWTAVRVARLPGELARRGRPR